MRKEVLNIQSIKSLIVKLRALENKNSNVSAFIQIPTANIFYFLVKAILSFYLKKMNAKVFDQFIGGVPILSEIRIDNNSRNIILRSYKKFNQALKYSTNLQEFFVKLSSYFAHKLSTIFPFYQTHRLVAGTIWHEYALKNIKPSIKIIPCHTYDYSAYLDSTLSPKFKMQKTNKKAVLLDAPGPLFIGDNSLSKRKDFFTSDIWYPALNIFFDFLESNTGVTIEVAGHHYSNHISPAPCFGNREVKYNLTRETVQQSNFVVTRNSTAISYAVIYRKPIIFIYSNQLESDSMNMRYTHFLAEMLGTKAINIDNFPSDFESYLKVDDDKYAFYEKALLTSDPMGRPIRQIILEDIIGVL